MSKQPLPFGEAKSCNDLECTFCPCGATRFSLHGATLRVNGREVIVLHLAESKAAWAAWAARPSGRAALAPYAAPPAGGRAPRACFEVDHLGGLTPDPALAHAGAVPPQQADPCPHPAPSPDPSPDASPIPSPDPSPTLSLTLTPALCRWPSSGSG